MAFEITIPRLGWSMEEGTFVRWLKKDGELVQVGDALYELEGEKAAQDIESVDAGVLRIPANSPQPGSVVAVGAVIGFLLNGNEPIPEIASSQSTKAPTASPVKSTSVPMTTETQEDSPIAAPSVRRMARELGVKLTSIAGSGAAGKILVSDVRSQQQSAPTVTSTSGSDTASPRARRIARELGVDWRRLTGTGRDGRVRECDVRQAATSPGTESNGNTVSVSSRRRTIANRMVASREQTAPVTLTTRIDATNLVNLRNQFKSAANGSVIPSYQDIVIKLTSLALQQHPILAARSEGDGWVIPQTAADYHIGFAVDSDDGLVVPVIKGVSAISLSGIAEQTQSLIQKVRSGSLSNAQMQGGVFTITNLGSFGIDAFTPIINLPETAVLGMGRIRREAVVVDNQIMPRDQLTLSLTFDHRIVDGAPAARFLQTLSLAIENPSAWLLRSDP